MNTSDIETHLFGRDELLAFVESRLGAGLHVLLVGPRDIGKTALIRALPAHNAIVIDPFERISSHHAAQILRGLDHTTQYLAAARSLDRGYLGAVRRIAWRFENVRVPPLPPRWMKRVIERECERARLASRWITMGWIRNVLRIAHGRPGLACAIVQSASVIAMRKGAVPSPAAAHIEASVRRANWSVSIHAAPGEE